MTTNETPADQECVFCAIAAGRAEASVVFEDDTVVVFMDLHPVNPGHLLVVPRGHAVGLEDLDGATGAHVFSVGHDMARALRRSTLRCDGINVVLCDGRAAFQTVFHVHLHVIPRHIDDGWTMPTDPPERAKALRDRDAAAIKDALAAVR
ncbi:HIT family protein [Cellulomonas sp. zg-ZUI222]|uniref:HIT family protein n=1 Tax=Cellulomonas wangleii TaxID=2816956 RepID=UPI001A94ECB4|nr:HIT family protein [Cellulomonas wangleii]MBO0922071.1 HIT family protein [Cellulomonas wangleii]